MIKKNKIQKYGGRVLASGGFGCVFTPALKCENSSKREKGKISKLMSEKHALQEYEEISAIREKLQNIPNYEDYFLVNDINICKPNKLTKDDLSDFDKKCSALPKDDITKKNINDSLDKILTLNMPNGGIPVDDFIYKDGSFKKLYNLNKTLIDLLNKGIIPMNKKNVYHCDIKDSNILVDENKSQLHTRLIDWGLATEYIPNKDEPFPKTWRNRPLQFNVPFSVIIFSDAFVQKYTEYINNGGKINKDDLKPFVIDYLHFWIKERGAGHYKFINEIMNILFSKEITSIHDSDKETVIENNFTNSYIINYIIEVLVHFTRFRSDETLNLRIYLDDVFIKIVDIWGFISVYVPLLDFLYENYDQLSDNQLEMFELIKDIFIKYLYSPRSIPIEHTELTNDLQKLSKLFKNEFTENARGIKRRQLNITSRKITGITGKTFVPKSVKLKFKKYNTKTKKSKTKKSKTKKSKLFMLSTKLRK